MRCHICCCEGIKILTTTLCKFYNCPNIITFKRISTQDNVMEDVFEAKKYKEERETSLFKKCEIQEN